MNTSEYIKQLIEQKQKLVSIHHPNDDVWLTKTRSIIKKSMGDESDEYQFSRDFTFNVPEDQKVKQQNTMIRFIDDCIDSLVTKSQYENKANKVSELGNQNTDKVFISYSWDSDEHNEMVLAFSDQLRKDGYHAEVDKLISQKETSIDFIEMMHLAMTKYGKVIIILSEGFKIKAENFSGGVGNEYSLVLKDIGSHPRKYILVSFYGINDNIIPLGLKGRDIVDVSIDGWEDKLYSKLSDNEEYRFSNVADSKRINATKEIRPFNLYKTPSIFVEKIDIKVVGSFFQMLRYIYIHFQCQFILKNIGNKTIDDFHYEIEVPTILLQSPINYSIVDSNYIITKTQHNKIYPNQNVITENFQITITNRNAIEALNSKIVFKLYQNDSQQVFEYLVKDYFTVKDAYQNQKKLEFEDFLMD